MNFLYFLNKGGFCSLGSIPSPFSCDVKEENQIGGMGYKVEETIVDKTYLGHSLKLDLTFDMFPNDCTVFYLCTLFIIEGDGHFYANVFKNDQVECCGN